MGSWIVDLLALRLHLPAWLIAVIIAVLLAAVLVKVITDAKVRLIRARGESDLTVAAYKCGLSHQRWMWYRRDRNRQTRAATPRRRTPRRSHR
ncbi:hypothetical protein ACIP98_38310 [Streptomyces sp. NPDC088354]|uniref:hypothetical protein n=1 Tax=Streptomyces sp. NPDC088354 TaxID=3365856 RepID=UPI003803AD53